LLYVAVALPFHDIVGLALVRSHAAVRPPLADQQARGGVMMLAETSITLAIIAIVSGVDTAEERRRGEVRRAARRRRLSQSGVKSSAASVGRGLSQSGPESKRGQRRGGMRQRG